MEIVQVDVDRQQESAVLSAYEYLLKGAEVHTGLCVDYLSYVS
jgi:hypothetical protein